MGGGSRGKPKPTLRDLSRHHPSRKEEAAIRGMLIESPSPIATAIIGATLVEREIETLIRKGLSRQDDDTLWKDMTDENGPISTFSQKTTLGFAMGLYDERLRKNLDIIRRIRNAFAHSKRAIDFHHDLVVKELLKAVPSPSTKEKQMTHAEIRAKPRQAYIELCFDVIIEASYAMISQMITDGRRALSDLDPDSLEGLLKRYPQHRIAGPKTG